MNNRQKKKRARIENNWYKDKILDSYNCPYCSWSAVDDEEMKHHKVLDIKHGHYEWYGYEEYDFEVICPYCKTKFKYSDSNM